MAIIGIPDWTSNIHIGDEISSILTVDGGSPGNTQLWVVVGPDWLKVAPLGNSWKIGGKVQGPTGYYRVMLCAYGAVTAFAEMDLFIETPQLDAAIGHWQAVIWRKDGSYINLGDHHMNPVDVVSPPAVKLEASAPSKAVIILDRLRKDPLSSDFDEWTYGGPGPVKEGMQLLIRLYDCANKSYKIVFNDTIKNINRTNVHATITAYDCLLALSEYKECVKIAGTQQETYTGPRFENNDDYAFLLSTDINEIVRVVSRDSCVKSWGSGDPSNPFVYAPIDEIIRMGEVVSINRCHKVRSRVGVRFMQKSQLIETWVEIWSVKNNRPLNKLYGTEHVSHYSNNRMWTEEYDLNLEPGTYWICTCGRRYGNIANGKWWPMVLTTTEKTDKDLVMIQGVVKTSGEMGYIGSHRHEIVYEEETLRNPSKVNVGNGLLSIPKSELGLNGGLYGLIVTSLTENVSMMTVAKSLARRAGIKLETNCESEILASYNTSTKDYLKTIQDLIGAGNILQQDIFYPNKIFCKPSSKMEDEAVLKIMSFAGGEGIGIVESKMLNHSIEARSTRPSIQSTDSDGLPMAIQSDDLLYGEESLESKQGYISTQIITDKAISKTAKWNMTLIAKMAGDRILRIHRNVIDGEIHLSDDYPNIWSDNLSKSNGGMPLLISDEEGVISAIPQMMIVGGRRTIISLNNIRQNDANTVKQGLDIAINTQSSIDLPDTVYLHIRVPDLRGGISSGFTGVSIVLEDGIQIPLDVDDVPKHDFRDGCGPGEEEYIHWVFSTPYSEIGYAVDRAINGVILTKEGSSGLFVPLENPIHSWPGQRLLVDVRIPSKL